MECLSKSEDTGSNPDWSTFRFKQYILSFIMSMKMNTLLGVVDHAQAVSQKEISE